MSPRGTFFYTEKKIAFDGFKSRLFKPRLKPDLSVPLLYANFPLTKVTLLPCTRVPKITPLHPLASPPRGRTQEKARFADFTKAPRRRTNLAPPFSIFPQLPKRPQIYPDDKIWIFLRFLVLFHVFFFVFSIFLDDFDYFRQNIQIF